MADCLSKEDNDINDANYINEFVDNQNWVNVN